MIFVYTNRISKRFVYILKVFEQKHKYYFVQNTYLSDSVNIYFSTNMTLGCKYLRILTNICLFYMYYLSQVFVHIKYFFLHCIRFTMMCVRFFHPPVNFGLFIDIFSLQILFWFCVDKTVLKCLKISPKVHNTFYLVVENKTILA